MKRIINHCLIYFSIFLIATIVGCQEDPDAIISVKNDPTIPIVSSTVKLIDKAKFDSNILSISSDSSTFTFKLGDESIENLETGNILVSDRGMGILRRVRNVQKTSDKIVFQTEQASITDIIERGTFTFSHKISREDIGKAIFLLEGVTLSKSELKPELEFYFKFNDAVIYDHDGDTLTKNDQVLLDGSIGISPSFTINIDISDKRLRKLNISTTFAESIELTSKFYLKNIPIKAERVLAKYLLKPIVFFVGWIPVVFTPYLTFNIGVDGNVYAAIEAKIEQNAELTAGLIFNNGSWTPYSNFSHDFGFQPPTFSAGANVKGYVGPKLEIFIYGIVGPNANLSVYADLEVKVIPEPKAELYAGIELGLGVVLKIFDITIADHKRPALIGIRQKLWEQTNLGGKISGNVKNAVTTVPLSNVKVVAYKNDLKVDSTFSKIDGTYELSLPVHDSYKVIFSKAGFLDAEYFGIRVTLFGNTILETILQIDASYSGYGSISGMIKNALTGSGVANLQLKLRKGINVTTGAVLKTTSSLSNGSYSFTNVEAGNYTVEVSGSGYNQTFFSVLCLGGQNLGNQDATVSPILTPGETRIVLTWGATPKDLDSHLTGPLQSGGRFHMYWWYKGNKSPWPDVVNLDLDDVDSYGPETTTLYKQITGTYRFYVHDYTNRNKTYSLELSNSGAQVRVYQSSGLVASFVIPPNKEGTLWTVFEMSGTSITPVNTFSYESDPANVGNLGKRINIEIEKGVKN